MHHENDIKVPLMSKANEQKKKAKQELKDRNKVFRYRVVFAKKSRLPQLADDNPTLTAELDTICDNNLVTAMLTLADIIRGVNLDLGAEPLTNSLDGTMVPYILGITNTIPADAPTPLPQLGDVKLPLQVKLCYDNEVRNAVVDWVKSRHEGVTTRLYVPILKLQNMVVEFNRVVRKEAAL